MSDAETAFGVMVRERRALLRLTQEDLRRRLLDGYGIDLSKTAMSRLEAGDRPIRLNEVSALAQLLEIDLSSYGRPSRKSEAQELDSAMADIDEQLAAVEAELAVASSQAAQARNAMQHAEMRLSELKARYADLKAVQSQVWHHLYGLADARKRLELGTGPADMLRSTNGDR